MFENRRSKGYEEGYETCKKLYEAKILDYQNTVLDLKVKLQHYEGAYGQMSYQSLLSKTKELEKEKNIFEAEKSTLKLKIDFEISKKEIELMKKYQDKLETIVKKQLGCDK
jgi:hypothetical protein